MKHYLIIAALLLEIFCPTIVKAAWTGDDTVKASAVLSQRSEQKLYAFWQSRDSHYNTSIISALIYQGPADVFTTSPYAAYSCTEAYTAAYAATLGAACDVVDTSTGLVTCTYHFQANGLVNPSECTGTSCATACRVAKAYDETGNGRHATQATVANMPGLTFSSSPTGTLPVIDCTVGTNPNLATAAQSAQVQPLAAFAVLDRTGAVQIGGIFGTVNSDLVLLQASSSANLVGVQSGAAAFLTATASDAAWHTVGTLANGGGSASAVNVDGSDTTGATGTVGVGNTDVLRICRAIAAQYTGRVAEITVWAAATTPTNRNSLSTNAHSAGRYNF